jgi:hypothetical protein
MGATSSAPARLLIQGERGRELSYSLKVLFTRMVSVQAEYCVPSEHQCPTRWSCRARGSGREPLR